MKKKIKINKPLWGYAAGVVITIETHENGTPVDAYWRRRFKDAKIDNCVEFVAVETKKKEAKKKKDKVEVE